MNWDRLSLVTAPTVLPVTLGEAKAQCRVDHDEVDDLIAGYIASAVGLIDGPRGIGICMVSQQWKLTLDGFPRSIRISLGPLISVDSITYVDMDGATQTLDAADYRVVNAGDLVRIEPAYGASWPSVRNVSGSVVITFTAGYRNTATSQGAEFVPADLRQAILMMVEHFHLNAGAVTTHGTPAVVPLGVEHILWRHRVGTVTA
jgi:uncharacterized phiE125 gp8 family phage protein